jgi:Domain of unknown function (DUF4430)
MIGVTVTIDFGPASKPGCEKVVAVAEKSTVLDALSIAVPVVTSPRYGMDHFVEAIDGIENDLAGDRGWRFEVNGRGSNVPAERYLVKDGDWIKWCYFAGGCS